jgi:prevent-host-death family protein
MKSVNIADAKAHLPELVDRASRGEQIVIARNGKPRARLVPLSHHARRVPGRGPAGGVPLVDARV